MLSNPCHNQLLKLLYSQEGQMDSLYRKLSKELAKALRQYKTKSSNGVWVRNSELEKKVDTILLGFNSELLSTIQTGSKSGWNLSEDCNDDLIKEYLRGIEIDSKKKQQLLFRNNTAVATFLKRKSLGLGLSDRVWNLTAQSKEQLEFFLQTGITEGRPAVQLATDLKQYLKEPNRKYRRIKDKNGKLIYSQPAKNYKPGQGVYKSSYKNALRLSRNEINIAYRTADYERRQTIPFARGIAVHLSSAHPQRDICDELMGDYPLTFKFVGWHPNCLCFTTTKLLSRKEFTRYLNGGKIGKNKYIKTIPKRAENHINSISNQIKGWSNKPYFITDNFKNTKEGFALKNTIQT